MEEVKTLEEFTQLLLETLDELDDLRASIAYDEEFMEGAIPVVEQLETGVKQLLASIKIGSYEPGKGELDFVKIAKNTDQGILPIRHLFRIIEKTHEQGLSS